jgi:tRNA A-37 threonylcarbamoyl transferase component Bud32
MGIVYRVQHTRIGKLLAMKLLHGELSTNKEVVRRFKHEALTVSKLSSPHTVQVFDYGVWQHLTYLVMELVEGANLARVLQLKGPMPFERAGKLMVQVCSSLSEAHSKGITHRDIKPENIMILRDEHGLEMAKVLDFGLAKLREPDEGTDSATMLESAETATNATAEGRVLGTPGYMSPEQARGQDVDHRTDLFALGVLLYEMLSGEAPFQGDTALDRLAAVTRDDPPPIDGLAPELDELLASCLAKDRDERLADAESFLESLAAAVDSSSTDTFVSTPRASTSGAAASVSAPPARTKPSSPSTMAGTEAFRGRPSTLTPRARLVRLGIGGALGIAVAIGVFAWRFGGQRGDPSQAAATDPTRLWTDPNSVLACPPLQASGVPEPAGWLGAAAADVACRRARLLMGGRYARTLIPAELLDMPTKVAASIPGDVYGDPKSRPRAIEAAKRRAAAWIDGTIAKSPQGFTVELVVRAKSGQEVARAKADGKYVHVAVRSAMEPLLKAGAIPQAKALEPEAARWSHTAKPRAAVAALDLDMATALNLGRAPQDECARVEPFRGDFDNFAPISAACTESRDGPDEVEPFPVDRSSPEGFAWTAPAALRYDKTLDPKELLEHAKRLLHEDKSAMGRGALGFAATWLAFEAGEPARLISFSAVQDDPRHFWGWTMACGTSLRKKGGEIANRAFQTWTPEQPDAWNIATFSDPSQPLEAKIRWGERAVALSPDYPLFAQNLAIYLTQAGRTEDVRSIAAHLARGGPAQQLGAEALLAQVETSEGKFERALQRSLAAHRTLETTTRLWWGDMPLTETALDAGLVLGRHHEVADELAERFVLADPPRLYAHSEYTSYQATLICLHASKSVATRCAARLTALMAGDYFKVSHTNLVPKLLEGLRHYLAGDVDPMVRAWRAVPAPMRGGEMRARLLAAAGRDDLAEQVDRNIPVGHGVIHGASFIDVRQAQRAEKRGDHAEARKLAQKVVDAWSDADADVPAVTQMRELIDRLP